MSLESKKWIKAFLICILVGAAGGITAACSVQWAYRNKHTDCEFSSQDGSKRDGRDGPSSITLYPLDRLEAK